MKFVENSSETEVESTKKEVETISYFQVAKRILIINRSEWFSMIIATLSAVIIGASFPIFAILFAEFYGVRDNIACFAVSVPFHSATILNLKFIEKTIQSIMIIKLCFRHSGIVVERPRSGHFPYEWIVSVVHCHWMFHVCGRCAAVASAKSRRCFLDIATTVSTRALVQ